MKKKKEEEEEDENKMHLLGNYKLREKNNKNIVK